ncbi:GGDEF domain-containing protein [Aliidiomarina indica]|uniref:GGDEF domain-containing protein n=1 Tax=Aliidiomarina indica TaxID=2749147 RepID=UPI00188DF206|nr:GGDEF domain-containing protein [Aliidiomarina indica]
MDIISIIVLTGIINLTFSLYSWQQVSNPESHAACKPWAQAQFVKAFSFAVFATALLSASDDLRLLANILIILGCWAEVRAYNKLADAGLKPIYLFVGFVITSAIFTYIHLTSGVGPNNTTVVAASLLLALPLAMNVYALYKLRNQHYRSVFPKVLFMVNLVITMLLVVRGMVAYDNHEYTVIEAWFINQLFMTATFVHALGNGIGFIGFLKERSDEKLQTRANIDYLTGIHNRQYFEKLVRARIAGNAEFTLYFLDIDKFKSVNDRFGHATGDEVLRVFSLLLLKQQERYDGVAGRLGGEEFGLLLPEQTPMSHGDIIQELRNEFATQAEKTLGEPLTFSLGACASSDADTVQDLMRKADVLLYKAKREA